MDRGAGSRLNFQALFKRVEFGQQFISLFPVLGPAGRFAPRVAIDLTISWNGYPDVSMRPRGHLRFDGRVHPLCKAAGLAIEGILFGAGLACAFKLGEESM